ncbi:thymus-specific serine protease-like [Drosophila tropicalis]|uniref:thymus-specific serine protease-like n=1 Tax=Drosophila tropicalis TaxID=46794 RepID=UPI0035ABAB8E
MKYFLIALTILAPLTAAASMGEDKKPAIKSAFVESLEQLHRPPLLEPALKRANVETRWFTQFLDNFDASNNATWQNRYMINEDYYVEGSPIFVYLGGEWAIDASGISSGLWVDIAKQHNGSLLYTEHRFFGESIPIKPLSTKNLKYQSVDQALYDAYSIIESLLQTDKYNGSKVVVSGCSYSASMATWMRQWFPDVVRGSWASSAPLVAKVDFAKYMVVIGKAYNDLGGEYCYNLIDNATTYYQNLFATGQGEKAKTELNLCEDFDVDSESDQWQIFSTIANIFAAIAQYQKPQNYDLPQYCSVLRSFSDDDATALSKFVQWRLKKPACVQATYQGAVDYYKWSKNNYDGSGLGWTYQTCNEFGWFQSSASSKQPFGDSFPATLYTDICYDVFSSNYTVANIDSKIAATNKQFGGLNPGVTNVYFVQGALDPWSKVGAGVSQGATIIPYASHCPDVESISASDSAELRASKEKLAELVIEWLK